MKSILAIFVALAFLWGGFYVGFLHGSDWWGEFPLIVTTMAGCSLSVVYAIEEWINK